MRFAVQIGVLLVVIATTSAQPSDWLARIAEANLFYAPTDTSLASNLYPMLGNGFVGRLSNQNELYVSGLFNGYLTQDPSHRAALPNALNVNISNTAVYAVGLDVERATYYRRSRQVDNPFVNIEQRWYAHRSYPSVFVMEMDVTMGDKTGPAKLALSYNNPASSDVTLSPLSNPPNGANWYNGSTNVPETHTSGRVVVSMVTSNVPSSLVVPQNTTFYYFTSVRTSADANVPPPTSSSELSSEAAAEAAFVTSTKAQFRRVLRHAPGTNHYSGIWNGDELVEVDPAEAAKQDWIAVNNIVTSGQTPSLHERSVYPPSRLTHNPP